MAEKGEMDEMDAGSVHVRWRWIAVKERLRETVRETKEFSVDGEIAEEEAGEQVEEGARFHGVLQISILSASDLRDISSLKIADIATFSDNSALRQTLAYFLIYFSGSMTFYAVIKGWWPWDAAFFVTCTFSTVGYGNQADYSDDTGNQTSAGALTSAFDRGGVIFNIVVGVAVLGVVMGVVGDWAQQQAKAVYEKKVASAHEKMHKALHAGKVQKQSDAPEVRASFRGTGDPRVDARMRKAHGAD
eukprot:COSAG06_NODE_21987_length_738_cov_1.416275_1_plen_245_part_11